MRKIITGFNAMQDQARSALHGWALHDAAIFSEPSLAAHAERVHR
jgi:hypothetical protein